jgi:hypothetical protein
MNKRGRAPIIEKPRVVNLQPLSGRLLQERALQAVYHTTIAPTSSPTASPASLRSLELYSELMSEQLNLIPQFSTLAAMNFSLQEARRDYSMMNSVLALWSSQLRHRRAGRTRAGRPSRIETL